VRFGACVLALGLSAAIAACSLTGIIGIASGAGGSTTIASVAAVGTSSTGMIASKTFDRVDVLLGIDNARGMADAQAILEEALGDLTEALVNPPCLDTGGNPVVGQPEGPFDACPGGSTRQFAPFLDIHVGVVTTSLGGHGSDACPGIDVGSCPGGVINASENDQGHLVTRVDPCSGAVVPTYQSQGFLAWDPRHEDDPPGTSVLTDFTFHLGQLVTGVGELGCRYGSQLESWYRLLIDPDPYEHIDASGGQIVKTGTDVMLLVQRQDFLRQDSLLAILMLSDEDDCSVQESGQSFLATQISDPNNPGQPFHLPRARAECEKSTSDPCCLPCSGPQMGCPVDPGCANPTLDLASDSYGLRCWDQKRRFGVDFLYPISRYVDGLTQPMVPDRAGEMVPNPIFTKLDPRIPVRDSSMVLLGGIVGVPWQDVARDPADLTKGFKDAEELAAASSGVVTWDVILGDPVKGVLPLDPHMIASTSPRTGTDPVTGTSLAPPGSPSGADPISGHEFSQATPDELEYACIYTLVTPRDCTDPSHPSCDCTDPQNDKPLCEPDKTKNNQPTLQVRAKATPALRQLQVLRGLGAQAAVASICPAPQANPSQLDFGYRPAIRALVERVSRRANAK
jgi:hypothetical protein